MDHVAHTLAVTDGLALDRGGNPKSGWRKPAPVQSLRTAGHSNAETRANEVERFQALNLVLSIAPALGLKAASQSLLRILFDCSQKTDWYQDSAPIVWPSNDYLRQALGCSLSALRRHSKVLVDRGLVRMKDSPNGKRFGRRCSRGKIVEAFGFDLSPIRERYEELQRLKQRLDAVTNAVKRLDRAFATRRRDLLELLFQLDAGQSLQVALYRLELTSLVNRWQAVRRARGLGLQIETKLQSLSDLTAELDVVWKEIEERWRKLQKRPESGSLEEETAPMGSEIDTHIHPTNQNPICIVDRLGEDEDRLAASLNRPRSSDKRDEAEPWLEAGPKRDDARSKRRPPFGVEQLRAAWPGYPPELYAATWPGLIRNLDKLSPYLGIPRDLCAAAVQQLGATDAVACLVLIGAKSEDGSVRNPQAYLKGMLRKHRNGELNLRASVIGRASAALAATTS